MELGGVGRVVGWVVTGTLRTATAVKLSRPEVVAISRTADAMVAILTVFSRGLLRDVTAMRRARMWLAGLDRWQTRRMRRVSRDSMGPEAGGAGVVRGGVSRRLECFSMGVTH